jgi:hypothetical protein
MPLAHMSSIYSLCFFILIPNVQKLTRFNGSGWWLDLIHVRVCTYMHAISVVVDGVRNWVSGSTDDRSLLRSYTDNNHYCIYCAPPILVLIPSTVILICVKIKIKLHAGMHVHVREGNPAVHALVGLRSSMHMQMGVAEWCTSKTE